MIDADNFDILVQFQASIVENFGILAFFKALIADNCQLRHQFTDNFVF